MTDNINVNINIACDNWCAGIYIDNVACTYTTTPVFSETAGAVPGYENAFTAVSTISLPSLAAGTHYITVVVNNWYNGSTQPQNFTGLAVMGTVSSATGSYSLGREDDAACTTSCSGEGRHAAPTTAPVVTQVSGSLTCFPNPNNGSFTLKGAMPGLNTSKTASIEVVDMLGKTVYRDVADIANGGTINKNITLDNNIANGVYLIKIKNDGTSQILRFSLDR
jgi:hypothetical protein